VLVVTAGCTTPPEPERAREETSKQVTPSAGATVDASPHLRVTVPTGAVDRDATLSVRPSSIAPPGRPGFVIAAPPVEVAVDAPLGKPVRLVFDGAGGPDGALPVLLHHDVDLGWYPIEVGEPGQEVVSDRTDLSPFALGWLTAPLDWLVDHLVGRRAAVTCDVTGPEWAEAAGTEVDLITSCLTDEAGQAVLKVRSNRRLPMEVTLPPGTTSISVEGQTDVVRQVLGAAIGADKVLLLEGQDLTVRWARPVHYSETTVQVAFTPTSVLAGVIAEVLGLDGSPVLLQLATFIARCHDAQQQARTSLGTPGAVGAALDFVADCLEPFTTVQGAAATAVPIIAALKGVSESVVVSEKAFAKDVDRLGGALRVAGKVIKFYTVAKLTASLAQVVADSRAPDSARSIVVRMSGTRSVAFTGYAGIRLGMTAADALAATAIPLRQKVLGPCAYLDQQDGAPGRSLSVLLNRRGEVLGIRVPPDSTTDRGVGVGSSLAAVRTAYRGSPIEEGISVSGYFVAITGPGGVIGFLAADTSTAVEALYVGSADFAKGFELCSGIGPPE
jgi:hypothetical protein